MPLRRYLLIQAYTNAFLAVLAAGATLFINLDTFGFCFLIGLSILLALISYSNFRAARKTRDEERAYAPPMGATLEQQKAYYTRIMGLGIVAFLFLGVMTIIDLNSLESGSEQSVELWAPVAFLYDLGGYWFAVLSVPLLGILTTGGLLWKIRKLDQEAKPRS